MDARTRSILIVIASVVVGGLLAFGGAQLLKSRDEPEPVAPTRRDLSSIIESKPRSTPPANADMGDVDLAPSAESVPRPSGDGCGRKPLFSEFGSIPPANGFTQSFGAYIPTRYDPTKRHAVLMLFHDDSQVAMQFMRVSGFVEIAEQLTFVIIAPQDPDVMAWSTKDEANVARDAMLAANEALCVDSSKLYAVGYGAGGRIVEEMPCIMEVAGIATAAYRSTSTDTVCSPPSPVPYIHLAPLKDGYSPPEGGTACGGLHSPISLPAKEKMWRERNHCTKARRTWLQDQGTKCHTWACDEPFASCHVDGGRGWPGTKRRIFDFKRCDGSPAEFPYAKTVWQFFARGPEE